MINYKNVGLAIDFYKNRGYTYIEVPWLVSEAAIKITLPENHFSLSTKFGELIGSAEQSFIQLLMDKKIFHGKYVTATPCFRDDDIDELHSRYFFKVELIEIFNYKDIANELKNYCGSMVNDALSFFWSITKDDCKFVKTAIGFDIEINNIEVGSYGVRKFGNFIWVYGTGYADPRFLIATK